MITSDRFRTIYLQLLRANRVALNANLFVFLEDKNDILNFNMESFANTEMEEYHGNDLIRVGLVDVGIDDIKLIDKIWTDIITFNKLRITLKKFRTLGELEAFYANFVIDVALFPVAGHTSSETLLPHMDSRFSIVYRENEMELSPTWFLRTLSMEMWIFTIIAYFVVYFGFFLTLFVYRKFRKINDKQNSTLGEVFMYMWTFIAAQGVESRWTKHAFWKVQVMNFSFLHLIVATGFSTFLVTLLSTKYYDMPFHELDDFARIRSHNICIWPDFAPSKYFFNKFDDGTAVAFDKWKDILNQPACDLYFADSSNSYEEKICKSEGKTAFIISENHVKDDKFKCPVVKLTKLIPNIQRTVMIRPGYRYKELFNRFIIRMMTSGAIQRNQNLYKKFVDQSAVYESMSTYNVETEGVMFLHIKYFVFMLVAASALAFVITALEWIFYYKHFLRIVNF